MARFTETSSDMAELKGQVVDILEDALANANAAIANEDRDEAVAEGEDPDGLAIIYGFDYDVIGDVVCEQVLSNNLEASPASDDTSKSRITGAVMDAYNEIIGKAEFPGQGFTPGDLENFKALVADTFMNWGLFR